MQKDKQKQLQLPSLKEQLKFALRATRRQKAKQQKARSPRLCKTEYSLS